MNFYHDYSIIKEKMGANQHKKNTNSKYTIWKI